MLKKKRNIKQTPGNELLPYFTTVPATLLVPSAYLQGMNEQDGYSKEVGWRDIVIFRYSSPTI